MRTIRTRYLPATDTKGARIVARLTDSGMQATLAYPHESADPHAYVAEYLAKFLGLPTPVRIVKGFNDGFLWEASATDS